MRTRTGFTLLEILLVLSLLLVLGSLAASRLGGMLERQQLRDVAEGVGRHLNQARLRAAESGLIYQFSAAHDGVDYLLAPLDSTDSSVSAVGQIVGQLPSTAHFAEVELAEMRNPSLDAMENASGTTWCTPILFFPDGTSSGGTIDIVKGDDRFVRLAVRGLTSACVVGEVQRRPSL